MELRIMEHSHGKDGAAQRRKSSRRTAKEESGSVAQLTHLDGETNISLCGPETSRESCGPRPAALARSALERESAFGKVSLRFVIVEPLLRALPSRACRKRESRDLMGEEELPLSVLVRL